MPTNTYKVTTKTGQVVYRQTSNGGTREISKSEYESIKSKEPKSSSSSRQKTTAKKSEPQKIIESVPLSEFGKKGTDTAVITRKDGTVEYLASGQTIYKAEKPSQYYRLVTKKSGEKVYQYAGQNQKSGSTIVKEVYLEPKPVYSNGTISGYSTGRQYKITSLNSQKKEQQQNTSIGVYDKSRAETRLLSPIEAIALQKNIQNTGMSYLNPQQPMTLQQHLASPKSQTIYFQPTEEGLNPFYVTSSEPIAKSISAAPKQTLFSKFKGSKIISEFKSGFGFEPSPTFSMTGKEKLQTVLTGKLATTGEKLNPFQLGVREISYTSGIVTGTIATSSYFWEGVGAKSAAQAYKYPKLWSGIESVSKIASSPVGKYAQKSGLILYAGFKSGELGYIGRTEGTTGIAREGFAITKTISAFAGFGIGFKEQTIQNLAETDYLIKGKSKAITEIRNNEFKTGVATKGTISEFYKGNLRREFEFTQIAKIDGQSKEVIRVTRPLTTRYGNNQLTTSTVTINAYMRSQTDLILPKKAISIKEYSDIKAIQESRNIMLTEVQINQKNIKYGIGKSNIQFKSGTELVGKNIDLINKRYGISKSSYGIADYGEFTEFKGVSVSIDKQVSSKIQFKETMIKVSDKEYFDIIGQSTLKSKQVSQQIAKNLLSQLQPQKLSETKTILKPISAKTQKTIKPIIKTSQEKPKSITQTIQTAQKFKSTPIYSLRQLKAPKSSLRQLQTPKSSLRQLKAPKSSLRQLQTPTSSLKQLQTPKSSLRQLQTPTSSLKQLQTPKSSLRQLQTPKSSLRQLQTPISSLRKLNFSNIPKQIDPFIIGVKLPTIKSSAKYKKQDISIPFKTKYSSSIEANLFEIRGKKPSKFIVSSGISLRPII